MLFLSFSKLLNCALVVLIDDWLFQVSLWSDPGPDSEESAICLECSGNTKGERCDECREGYFRKPGDSETHDCYP